MITLQYSRLLSRATAIVSLVMLACVAQAGSVQELRFEPNDTTRDRVVPIKVYCKSSNQSQPVVFFSHGLGGSRENSAYLGNYWAVAGYIAIFVQHPGSDEEVWKSVPAAERLSALKKSVSVKTSRDRFIDIPFVIDQLEIWNEQAGHPLEGMLDLSHIGMSGHSYGAVTTMAVAGRKYPLFSNFADQRIDAFLAMSPQPARGNRTKKFFGHLNKPTLLMTGTKDGSPINANMKPSSRRKVYAALPPSNKFQLVLDGANHFTFGDANSPRNKGLNPKHHSAIQQISLQFWNAYLKDDTNAKQWLQSMRAINDTGLSQADDWEWK